jgi:hypothetical protein
LILAIKLFKQTLPGATLLEKISVFFKLDMPVSTTLATCLLVRWHYSKAAFSPLVFNGLPAITARAAVLSFCSAQRYVFVCYCWPL